MTAAFEFQTPGSQAPFAAPTTPQTNLIQNRFSHYLNKICDDIDRYERDKVLASNSLLKLHGTTLLLDMPVARKIPSLTARMVEQFKSLESIDTLKFGKVIKLLENAVTVSTELDIIEDYAQNKNRANLFSALHLISYAVEACGILFEILVNCQMDKQFVSLSLVTTCLQVIKNQLDYIIYPFIDLTEFEDENEVSSLNENTRHVYALIESSSKEKALISALIPHTVRFLRHAYHLIQHADMDDDILVIVAYIGIAPFFHDYSEQNVCILLDSKEENNTFFPYEQLKLNALQILKHIFCIYPRHRRWIFEEILTSLGSITAMSDKKNYQLHNDQSIHVISALFMELVQACAALNNKAAHKNWFKKWSIKYQKAQKSNESEKLKLLNDQLLTRAANTWRLGAEAAANSASFFLEFLMSKCKSKKIDTYSLTEYRQLLVNTLEDIMTVFNDPEWPVAELIMKVFSRILISLLEGNHHDQYLKSLAVEWLGIIACRIKSSQNALSEETDLLLSEWVYDLNEKLPVRVDKDTPIESIELLNQCRKKLMDSVAEEGMSANVTQFYLCHWGFTESVVWTKANKGWKIAREPKSKSVTKKDDSKEVEKESDSANMEIDDNVVEEKGEDLDQEEMSQEEKWPIEIVNMLQDTCKYYWQSCLGFECSFPKPSKSYTFPDMSRKESAGLVELLSSRQTLYTSYDFIMSEILMCLDKDAAYLRVKSLKAIRSISSQSPEILEEGRIRTSVVQRIHDTSPSVRDAAVEVIAKYLSQQQDVSYELYGLVSGRIMDTSVSVRKRLVKLLGELYFRFTDIEVKKDIASKLIMRIGDNEVTISQLSLKVTQKILFLPFKEIEKDGNDYFGSSYANATKDRKRCIDSLTGIITGAVAKLDSSVSTRNFALTQIVQKTIDGIDEEPRDWYEKIFQWINDSLFDRLMQLDQELDTTDFINCLATIHSFAKSCPNLLREIQITILQPYLSITEEDDYTIASYVLMIYRDVLPQMKHHGRSSIELLERILLQLLTRCPLDMVSASASCLCVIVSHISHRYNILIKILGSSVAKLRQTREAILHGNVTERTFSGVLKMILLCGLLCQHFEFDKRRQEEPHAMAALDLVYRGNIGILVYDLLKFYTGEDMEELAEQGMTLRTTALQGLGYFYSSYPTFMISEASTQLMDKIFREGTPSLKTKLMHVFQEFLGAEEGRIGKRDEEEKKGKDQRIGIDTLLGNTEEYAELGVNGSLMQRYLPKILECALSDLTELRYPAFDVVSTVIHCGLAHPVLCMPAIVAAETSPDISLRTKAYYMHKYAHDKYGSLLYIQMNEYINKSFQYQRLLFGSGVQGYGKRGGDAKIEAVLSLSYSILKEHKKSRFDFFYALIKPFLFELKLTNPEDIDITFLKYLAENMMMLDFATTNEVLFLVYHIDRLLMTLGADLLSFVQFLKKQGKMGEPEDMSEEDIDISMMEEDVITSSKLSIVLCMIMLLKKLLIELYDIPDQEIREYNPNNTRRPRDVMKDIEMSQTIEWEEEITYFQHNCLDRRTGIQACSKFEYLIMNDATAIVTTDFE